MPDENKGKRERGGWQGGGVAVANRCGQLACAGCKGVKLIQAGTSRIR